jgi:hypothetical protein
MVHQYRPNFPHRFNADGSYDSICTLCRLAVATTRIEAELSQHEQNHKCGLDASTPRIRLSIQSKDLLSFCRRLKATASWVAYPWRVSASIRPGKRSVRDEGLQVVL